MVPSINDHEGKKYLVTIHPAHGVKEPIEVDVYCILEACGVTDQAVGHAIKKLLFLGKRGKGTRLADLKGAIAAVSRAHNMEERRLSRPQPNEP